LTPSPGTGEPDLDAILGEETTTPEPPVFAEPPAEGGSELAAEPMASVEPMTEEGPVGLLALIATVCVLGVSIGTIRAILAQRASRAGIA
jgi:hypothetical protein